MSLSWAEVSSPAALYLAPDRVILRVRGTVHQSETREAGWAGAIAALKSLLEAQRPRGRARIALSAHFAPLWLLPGAPTPLNYPETRGWVESQVLERFGDLASNWRLAFRPGPAGEAILASGVDGGHWAELMQCVTKAGLDVASVVSWPALALALARHAGRATARLALAEPGRMTLVSLARGDVVALDSARGESPENDLADLLARAALVDGLREAPLLLVGTGVPGDWNGVRVLANTADAALPAGPGEPDFLLTRPRPPFAAWLLLAAGLGLAVLAGRHYLALAEQSASLEAREAAISAPGTHGHGGRRSPAENPAAAWGGLLHRLETLRPRQIALLSLRGDALRGEARLTAEARSAADMLAWLAMLRAEAGFSDASLVRHAIQFEDARQPLRFEIRLTWGGK